MKTKIPEIIADFLQLVMLKIERKKLFFTRYIGIFLNFILELICEISDLERCAWCSKHIKSSTDSVVNGEEKFCSSVCENAASTYGQDDFFQHEDNYVDCC